MRTRHPDRRKGWSRFLVRLLAVSLPVVATGVWGGLPTSAANPSWQATDDHEPLTAAGVVAALVHEGVAAPNPIDTTTQECPTAGCAQAIVTDTMRVKSFATPREANWYAMTRRLPRFANIVVEFAPPLSLEQRDGYLGVIGQLLP